ncbi:SIMPL domain-containing protein, partial [Acinetobacter baumannii]
LNAEASRLAPNDLARAQAYIELGDTTPGPLAKKVNAAMQSALATTKPYTSVKVRSGNTSTYPVYSKNGRTIESWRMRSELLLESKDQAALSELLGKLQTQLAVGQL